MRSAEVPERLLTGSEELTFHFQYPKLQAPSCHAVSVNQGPQSKWKPARQPLKALTALVLRALISIKERPFLLARLQILLGLYLTYEAIMRPDWLAVRLNRLNASAILLDAATVPFESFGDLTALLTAAGCPIVILRGEELQETKP